jgi:hypothetical protein
VNLLEVRPAYIRVVGLGFEEHRILGVGGASPPVAV